MTDFMLKRDCRQSPFEEEKSLKVIIPICSCCNKIHVDNNSWQQLEIHLSEYSDAALSHGLCPNCYAEQKNEFMKYKSKRTAYQTLNNESCN